MPPFNSTCLSLLFQKCALPKNNTLFKRLYGKSYENVNLEFIFAYTSCYKCCVAKKSFQGNFFKGYPELV